MARAARPYLKIVAVTVVCALIAIGAYAGFSFLKQDITGASNANSSSPPTFISQDPKEDPDPQDSCPCAADESLGSDALQEDQPSIERHEPGRTDIVTSVDPSPSTAFSAHKLPHQSITEEAQSTAENHATSSNAMIELRDREGAPTNGIGHERIYESKSEASTSCCNSSCKALSTDCNRLRTQVVQQTEWIRLDASSLLRFNGRCFFHSTGLEGIQYVTVVFLKMSLTVSGTFAPPDEIWTTQSASSGPIAACGSSLLLTAHYCDVRASTSLENYTASTASCIINVIQGQTITMLRDAVMLTDMNLPDHDTVEPPETGRRPIEESTEMASEPCSTVFSIEASKDDNASHDEEISNGIGEHCNIMSHGLHLPVSEQSVTDESVTDLSDMSRDINTAALTMIDSHVACLALHLNDCAITIPVSTTLENSTATASTIVNVIPQAANPMLREQTDMNLPDIDTLELPEISNPIQELTEMVSDPSSAVFSIETSKDDNAGNDEEIYSGIGEDCNFMPHDHDLPVYVQFVDDETRTDASGSPRGNSTAELMMAHSYVTGSDRDSITLPDDSNNVAYGHCDQVSDGSTSTLSQSDTAAAPNIDKTANPEFGTQAESRLRTRQDPGHHDKIHLSESVDIQYHDVTIDREGRAMHERSESTSSSILGTTAYEQDPTSSIQECFIDILEDCSLLSKAPSTSSVSDTNQFRDRDMPEPEACDLRHPVALYRQARPSDGHIVMPMMQPHIVDQHHVVILADPPVNHADIAPVAPAPVIAAEVDPPFVSDAVYRPLSMAVYVLIQFILYLIDREMMWVSRDSTPLRKILRIIFADSYDRGSVGLPTTVTHGILAHLLPLCSLPPDLRNVPGHSISELMRSLLLHPHGIALRTHVVQAQRPSRPGRLLPIVQNLIPEADRDEMASAELVLVKLDAAQRSELDVQLLDLPRHKLGFVICEPNPGDYIIYRNSKDGKWVKIQDGELQVLKPKQMQAEAGRTALQLVYFTRQRPTRPASDFRNLIKPQRVI